MTYGGAAYGAIEWGGMFVFVQQGHTFIITGSGVIVLDSTGRMRFISPGNNILGIPGGGDFWQTHAFPGMGNS